MTQAASGVVADEQRPPAVRLAPARARGLSAVIPKSKIDKIMSEEVREWLVQVLGDDFSEEVKSSANVVDSLRNGVLLCVLMQKLKNPSIEKVDIKLPKSSVGFFARENVAKFLQQAAPHFNIRPEVMFTDADLCDSKSDRQVVTCLLSIAGISYRTGGGAAPAIVLYDKEIEEQAKQVSDADLAVAIGECQRDSLQPIDENSDEDVVDVSVAAAADAKSAPPVLGVAVLSLQPLNAALPEPHKPARMEPKATREAPCSVSATFPSTAPRYRPKRSDEVDVQVGKSVNTLVKKHAHTNARIMRMSNQGQYVVYHQITGKRTVVYVRVVQKNLMIRVGGGWNEFEDWLSKHLVDCENS